MESVPGAVATGYSANRIEFAGNLTRSLPLPVLTSSSKLGHYQPAVVRVVIPVEQVFNDPN
jgi:hypothetical protein